MRSASSWHTRSTSNGMPRSGELGLGLGMRLGMYCGKAWEEAGLESEAAWVCVSVLRAGVASICCVLAVEVEFAEEEAQSLLREALKAASEAVDALGLLLPLMRVACDAESGAIRP